MERYLLIAAAVAFCFTAMRAEPAAGEVRTQAVEYHDGNTPLIGYLAYDDSFEGKRPGVLVVHEWWGLNDYAKLRARQLAALGYIALAADMYGGGKVAATQEEARLLAAPLLADRALMRRRAQLALDILRSQTLADADKLAAIGYCFGGTSVLELARSGADLQAVVSFHGGLSTPAPADARNIKAKLLVLHGGDDPSVSPEQLAAFIKEMRDGRVNWQMDIYGGAVHAFTNPAAGDDPSKGVAYNEQAARRSWDAMKLFFAETIGLPKGEDEEGIIGFMKEKVVKPVGKAGVVTGKAVKKAAEWVEEKVKGDGGKPAATQPAE